MRKSKVWIVTMLLAGLLAGCGSGSMKNASDMQTSSSGAHNSMMNKVEYSENYETDAMEDMAEESTEETNLGGQETGEQAPVVNGRKLIKTIDMRLETLTYDDTIAYIQNSVNKVGGYIESMSLEGDSIYSKNGNRYASLKVRIPEQKAQTFSRHPHL